MTNLKEAMEIASIAFESTRQKIEQATKEIEMVEQFIQENYMVHIMKCFVLRK
jgi:Xaa-Pro aminopeptidase